MLVAAACSTLDSVTRRDWMNALMKPSMTVAMRVRATITSTRVTARDAGCALAKALGWLAGRAVAT